MSQNLSLFWDSLGTEERVLGYICVTIITLIGGFYMQTQSLWMTDIAHHNSASAILYLAASQCV